jgi:DNA-binding CsgD family transcriptional regulator
MPSAICAGCDVPARLRNAAVKFALTENQLEICALIGGGETYKSAADKLKISRMAVFWRLRAVMRKTNTVTTAAAFFRLGLA